jgi:sulfur-carrier protein adenylyltransferase/sulfurtransferase
LLTPSEIVRYQRHLSLPQVGHAGQEALKASSVLVVGAGGLGAPLGLYLAASGIGRIGIVDFDEVDESNLQRQVLFDTPSVGRLKVEAAAERLSALNPYVEIDLHPIRLSPSNALSVMAPYDVVADGTDNFPTRYLINDACVLLGKPNVYGSIFRFEGQVSVFGAPGGPCYRCLYATPPPPESVPSCAEGGVFGVLPGLIGTIQATEVIKGLLGIGHTLAGRLLLIDTLSMQFRSVEVARDPACPVCGDSPTITELVDYDAFCGVPPPESVVAIPSITPRELMRRLHADDTPLLLDVRTEEERAEASLGGELIPLAELPDRIGELDRTARSGLVVYCRSGQRSAQAVRILLAAGFEGVANLEGGMLAWQREQAVRDVVQKG